MSLSSHRVNMSLSLYKKFSVAHKNTTNQFKVYIFLKEVLLRSEWITLMSYLNIYYRRYKEDKQIFVSIDIGPNERNLAVKYLHWRSKKMATYADYSQIKIQII